MLRRFWLDSAAATHPENDGMLVSKNYELLGSQILNYEPHIFADLKLRIVFGANDGHVFVGTPKKLRTAEIRKFKFTNCMVRSLNLANF
jgi:hypothetical protein